jgi:hypothetical protein
MRKKKDRTKGTNWTLPTWKESNGVMDKGLAVEGTSRAQKESEG